MEPTVRVRVRCAIKALLGTGGALLAAGFCYWATLCWPQPAFGWSAKVDNLSLHAAEPFSQADGRHVLERVSTNLKASSLYSSRDRHAAFVCGPGWRHDLLMATAPRAGGINVYPFTTNVFLSGADIPADRMISPSGGRDRLGRTLDHFIAHEIAHTLEARAVGQLAYRRMPNWAKEGYCEYVGHGKSDDYSKLVAAWLANAPEMNFPPAAPYLRFRLLVTHLLEKRGWTPPSLLETKMTMEQAERLVRTDLH
jgi:hypothetical protein